MSWEETLKSFKQLETVEREKFLDWIEAEYFDRGLTPEQLREISRVMQDYRDGYLIEVNPYE